MQVVILAGGLGTRIRSVTAACPKSLIPVAGKPFVEHQFVLLRRHHLTNVLFCIGHQGDQIRAHVGDGSRFGLRVSYAEEEPGHLLGTGGALVNALPKLQGEFLVLYGDSYLPTDYAEVVRTFRDSGLRAMMTVFKNDGKWDRSNVRVAKNMVVFYAKTAEPGEADCIDYGLSAFRRSVIEDYSLEELPLDLARVQAELVTHHEMGALMVSERFYEVGSPTGLEELNRVLGDNP